MHSDQFPNFLRAYNSQSLFLVACWSTSISIRYTELLHAWAVSDDGNYNYYYLLRILQDPLPPDELMLHMEALVLLYDMSVSTERDDMQSLQRVGLVDFDHLLKGQISIHKSQAILREMVWAFSRAIVSAILPDSQIAYLSFLAPAQTIFRTLEQRPDTDLDNYLKRRLQNSFSHADTYAQVQKDASSGPAPVRPPLKHVDRDEDEMSNHNTVSTSFSGIPLFRVEHGNHAGETGSSCLRWGAFLDVFGSCGGRKVQR